MHRSSVGVDEEHTADPVRDRVFEELSTRRSLLGRATATRLDLSNPTTTTLADEVVSDHSCVPQISVDHPRHINFGMALDDAIAGADQHSSSCVLSLLSANLCCPTASRTTPFDVPRTQRDPDAHSDPDAHRDRGDDQRGRGRKR